MTDKIRVSELKNVHILCKEDVYDLAHLLLKLDDAKDKGTNGRTRHTIRGLAARFTMLSGIDFDEIEKVFLQYNLPLDAIIEYDEDV